MRADGRKMVIPTRRLSEVTVINYQRSRNHVVNLALVVSAQVPTAALDDLRRSIQKFIADRRAVRLIFILYVIGVLIYPFIGVLSRSFLRVQNFRRAN